jgi:hypothetical protein
MNDHSSTEWKPVRIIANGVQHYDVTTKPAELGVPKDRLHGVIVRVRPTQDRTDYICDGLILSCHPEDAQNILKVINSRSVRFCEHQLIIAD